MYKLTSNAVLRSDGTHVPLTLGNTDYEAYLVWLSEGNTPEPADIPIEIIQPISPRQIRMALTRTNLRAAVETAVSVSTQDLKDWWEFSTTFERMNPQVTMMGIALGQSTSQLDALWKLGATL